MYMTSSQIILSSFQYRYFIIMEGRVLTVLLLSFISVCNTLYVNVTNFEIECVTIDRNGEEIYGIARKSTPRIVLPCYDEYGSFNCRAFFGGERQFCEEKCCATAKKDEAPLELEIECKELIVGGKKVQGVLRKTSPFIELQCYEGNGISTCLSFLGPERKFCNETCCNGSTAVEVHNEWDKPEIVEGKDPLENSRKICDKTALKRKLISWRRLAYIFEITSAVLLVMCIIFFVMMWLHRRKLQKYKRVRNPTD